MSKPANVGVVVASCPTMHYDVVAARCSLLGLTRAFTRGWDVVEDVNAWLPHIDKWMPQWEASIVAAALQASREFDPHGKVKLVFIQGGPCCDLEISRFQALTKAIKAATAVIIRVKVEVLEFEDFMEQYRLTSHQTVDSNIVRTTMKYYRGPLVEWTRDSQQDTYYPGPQSVGITADAFHNRNLVELDVSVQSARHLQHESSLLKSHGFMLAQSPTSMKYEDFYLHEKVVGIYFREVVEMLQKHIGAKHVLPFAYIVRSHTQQLAGKRVEGAERVQIVAPTVHCDHTVDSSQRLLHKLAEPPSSNDAFHQGKLRQRSLSTLELAAAERSGNWSVIHVWRNIRDEPVQNIPLAVADWTKVSEEDLCRVNHYYYPASAVPYAENYYVKFNEKHTWHFFENMVRDEALIFATWSSARYKQTGKAAASSVMHAAFADPRAPPEAPDREAIDLRCLCIFDEDLEYRSSRL